MAKKGKEPAGLRRYRLAQKAKKNKRATSRPKTQRKVKTMARRRSYGKKRSGGRKKFSAWRMAKGVMYTGAVALPIYGAYTQGGGGAAGATAAVKAAAFMNPEGQFSLAHGAQIWTPVAILAVVDFATTKLPIQQKISKGINNLLG